MKKNTFMICNSSGKYYVIFTENKIKIYIIYHHLNVIRILARILSTYRHYF